MPNTPRSKRYNKSAITNNIHMRTGSDFDNDFDNDFDDFFFKTNNDPNQFYANEEKDYDDEQDQEYFNKPEENIYKEIFEQTVFKMKLYLRTTLNEMKKKVPIKNKFFKPVSILLSIIILPFTLFLFHIYYAGYTGPSFMDQPLEHSPLHKIIIPYLSILFPKYGLSAELDDIFDSRLTPALLLLSIQSHLLSTKRPLREDFTIPFSWEDWIDIDSKIRYDDEYLVNWLSVHSDEFLNDLDELYSLDCQTFAMLYGCEGNFNFMSKCENLETPIHGYPYKFKITGPTDAKIKEPGRLLYSGAYLKFHMPPPSQIYLLDIFGDSGEGSLMIDVELDSKNKKILRNSEVLKQFIEWEVKHSVNSLETVLKTGWTIETLRKRTSFLLNKFGVSKVIDIKNHRTINNKGTYLAVDDSTGSNKMKMSHWKFDDFIWNEEEFLSQLSKAEGNYDNRLYDTLEGLETFRTSNGYHPKYLYEAQLYESSVGSHYDWRFFSGTLITNDQRQSVIHRLSRTWLRFCLENGLKTFIAYGSMLGWIRNGLTLPWDGDIDVIVTVKSLDLLARNFNQTLIVDYSTKDGFQAAMTGYLIDINPAYYSRFKGDGNNVIDGRLIDINTGIYLDITALSWTENYLKSSKINDKIKKIVDKDYEMNQYFALEGDDVYHDTLMAQLKKLQQEKQLVHCKNDNAYTVDELSSMIPSYFEGVRAYFPHKYEDIIWRLYPTALTRNYEPDHIFDDKYRLWINMYDCPELTTSSHMGECNNTRVINEYMLTHDYTARHIDMMENGDWLHYFLEENTESKPLRIDEFFMYYSSRLGLSDDELLSFYL